MHLLWILAAVLCLFVAGAQPVPTVEVIEVRELMNFACDVLAYECTHVPTPSFVFVPLWSPDYPILGTYDGARIWIDNGVLARADPVVMRAVIVHEITHYLDHVFQGDMMFHNMESLCATEWNGWRVQNAYYLDAGRPEFTDFAWNIRYNCY